MAKLPRWADDPPPGFAPDGKSLIVPKQEDIEWTGDKIRDTDGKVYTAEEWEKKQEAEEADISDLNDEED